MKSSGEASGPGPARKWAVYRSGELEIILSLVPTRANIAYLARLLDRSEAAIALVYRLAYTKFGSLRGRGVDVQRRKIRAVRDTLGIDFWTQTAFAAHQK